MADEKWRIVKTLRISSGHKLDLNYDSPCKRLHGHNWKVKIIIEGNELDENGMLIDFVEVKKVVDLFDHRYLNDLIHANPTAEIIAREIADRINKRIKELSKNCKVIQVKVWETPDNLVIYDC